SHAKVYVSVMTESTAAESIEGLNKAAGFLRASLAKRIKMRIMPTLHFVYDDTTIKANNLSRLIDEACSTDKPKKDSE
ncbi:MAG: 30S ribosome-binding factor RbfA, partial [bacterium]|nr:30S ribosome-binding factor RbfA [bacterium]